MKRWYKGNLHSHTTNSDGVWTPEQSAKNYRDAGYSFLCFSDHDLYTDYRRELGEKNFLILPGVEATAVLFDDEGNTVRLHHMNGILGTESMQKGALESTFSHMEKVEPDIYYGTDWDGNKTGKKLAERLKNHGCIVTYNHPIWSRVRPEDFINIPDINMLEIFNYNTVNECGMGYDVTYWDLMLRSGRHINADATDDNHNGGSFPDSFGGYIVVQAEELSHEAICQAILNGEYYSSSGPEIYDWKVENNQFVVNCSAVERINMIVGGPVALGVTWLAEHGVPLTEAFYPLTGKETYIRAECIDEHGHTAWTNPIWLSEFAKRRK